MTPNRRGDPEQTIDRRTVLQNRIRTVGGLALGAVAVSGNATADKWDKVVDQTGNTFDDPLFVLCVGETLTVTSGVARYDTDVRKDTNGGFHVDVKQAAKVKLEGDETGIRYENSFSTHTSLYEGADSRPFTTTTSSTFTLIGTGKAPNLRAKILSHLTFDANGDLSVDVKYEAVECMR